MVGRVGLVLIFCFLCWIIGPIFFAIYNRPHQHSPSCRKKWDTTAVDRVKYTTDSQNCAFTAQQQICNKIEAMKLGLNWRYIRLQAYVWLGPDVICSLRLV